MKQFLNTVIVALLITPVSSAFAGNDPKRGCYVPVRGYALNICEDPSCATQNGVFWAKFRDETQKNGGRRLVIAATTWVEQVVEDAKPEPKEECGWDPGIEVYHILEDRIRDATIETSGTVCFTEFIPDPVAPETIKFSENLILDTGTGPYEGINGEFFVTGSVNTQAGIVTFEVVEGLGGLGIKGGCEN